MSTTPPSPAPPEDSSSGLRLVVRIFLVALLVISAIALFIDWQAMKASEEAYERVKTLDEKDATKKKLLVQTDIRQAIGRDPTSGPDPVPNRSDLVVETYTWTRGLPWQSYNVRVYYVKGETGSLKYSTVSNNLDLSTPDPEATVHPPVAPPDGPPLLPPGPPMGERPPPLSGESPAATPPHPADAAAGKPADKAADPPAKTPGDE